MKRITRVDRNYHHCWKVSIAINESWGVTKSFYDQKCGGKDKALILATRYRDQQLKLLKNHLADSEFKGWSELWHNRGEWSYLYIYASYTKNHKQQKRKFSVNKYGYDEAIKLAIEWRKSKLAGEL